MKIIYYNTYSMAIFGAEWKEKDNYYLLIIASIPTCYYTMFDCIWLAVPCLPVVAGCLKYIPEV